MIKNSTQSILLQKLFELLERHRIAFQQERTYWRAVGMVLGEIFNFGRHTVTQTWMALGITDGDWSSWYRLFSRGRYEEKKVAQIFFRETLQHVNPEEPYVVGADGVQIPRSSLKMPGTWSFPSGHSASAFGGVWLLNRKFPRLSGLTYTLASLVAFSRIYLGDHYPGDVASGSLFGLLFARLFRRVFNRGKADNRQAGCLSAIKSYYSKRIIE